METSHALRPAKVAVRVRQTRAFAAWQRYPRLMRIVTLCLTLAIVGLAATSVGRLHANDARATLDKLVPHAAESCADCLLGAQPGVTRMIDVYQRLHDHPIVRATEAISERAWNEGVLLMTLDDDLFVGIAMGSDGLLDRLEFGWQPGAVDPRLVQPAVGDILMRFGAPDVVTLATPACEGGFRLHYARSNGWLTVKTDERVSLRPETPVTALRVSTAITGSGVAWHGFASAAYYDHLGAC